LGTTTRKKNHHCGTPSAIGGKVRRKKGGWVHQDKKKATSPKKNPKPPVLAKPFPIKLDGRNWKKTGTAPHAQEEWKKKKDPPGGPNGRDTQGLL